MKGLLKAVANDSSTLQIKHHQTKPVLLCHLFLSAFGLSSMRNKPVLILRLWELVIKLTLPPPSAGGLCGVYTPCSFFRFALNDLTVEGNQTQSHILMQLRLEVYIQHATVSFVGIFFLMQLGNNADHINFIFAFVWLEDIRHCFILMRFYSYYQAIFLCWITVSCSVTNPVTAGRWRATSTLVS